MSYIQLISRPRHPRLYRPLRLQSSASAPFSNWQQGIKRRGGLDLTHRDSRLAKSLRQKQALARVGLAESNALDPSSTTDKSIAQAEGPVVPPKKYPTIFRGIILPQKPRPPESDECCMSGCAVCVYDLYISSLESYQEAVSTVRSALRAQNIPVQDWPEGIQENTGEKDTATSSDLDVNMSAFAALEKSLREASSPSV